MHYENRQPPEGINVTKEHPLRQFVRLAIAATVLMVLVVGVLQFSGGWLAKRIPFSFEQRVMRGMEVDFSGEVDAPELTAYLNDLAQRLIKELPMEDGMDVIVHYNPDDTFNAFATVGGNLQFYRGLLVQMPNENALAMVMAHEISHVMHRDPVAGLGGGVASMLAMMMLTGNAGTGMAGDVLTRTGVLTSIQFTRRMEMAADNEALPAVYGLYGHVEGAGTLFELVAQEHGGSGDLAPVWLERFASTHPLDSDRVEAITARAAAQGWPVSGEMTPLPEEFFDWLEESAN
ncbi:MAG: M48 family metallopeptidase [Granulosicoccus sp.]